MRLTLLGTGTSMGVPQIGCGCATCRSEDPRDRRSRTAAVISSGETTLLIDTPPELRLAIIDAEGEIAERFRKNAVWFFTQMVRYKITADDTKALIRNMHYIQTPQANKQKRQMAYVSLQALRERYDMEMAQ